MEKEWYLLVKNHLRQRGWICLIKTSTPTFTRAIQLLVSTLTVLTSKAVVARENALSEATLKAVMSSFGTRVNYCKKKTKKKKT